MSTTHRCNQSLIVGSSRSINFGFIFHNLILFITSTKTSEDAWTTLGNTYVKPSHGKLKQLKEELCLLNKGTKSVVEYIQQIKIYVNELVMMNSLIDNKDLMLKILVSLDNDYKDLCSAMHV